MSKHSSISATDPARGSSLMSIKMAQKAREEDEKIKLKRRKGIIVQVMQFLQDHGLYRSLDAMQAESNMSLGKFLPADNIDLTSVFSEYEEFVELKFGRKPKLYRVVEGADENATASYGGVGEKQLTRGSSNRTTSSSSSTPTTTTSNSGRQQPHRPPIHPNTSSDSPANPSLSTPTTSASGGSGASAASDILNVRGGVAPTTKIRQQSKNAASASDTDGEGDLPGFQGRSALMRPLPHFPSQELNEIAGMIHREILDRDPGIGFNDIAELENAKQLLKEAVVMPIKYPQFFTGLLKPWNGILLFGPSGVGKTMLAKAVATECKTTFFNISAASIVSKWRGDSEKLVRMLFDLAIHFAPSTVFIDELDSVLSSRASDGSEHEASRRMKTEFLIQMDGLAKREKGEVVFVMAASNLPWDLDAAVLRRLEKRIMVGLPTSIGREKMFRRLLLEHTKKDFDFNKCAEISEGYSGADIDILCREAMMRSVRVLIKKLETEKQLSSTPVNLKPQVSVQDVIESTNVTRASVQAIPTEKYEAWEKKFGSTISS